MRAATTTPWLPYRWLRYRDGRRIVGVRSRRDLAQGSFRNIGPGELPVTRVLVATEYLVPTRPDAQPVTLEVGATGLSQGPRARYPFGGAPRRTGVPIFTSPDVAPAAAQPSEPPAPHTPLDAAA
jgi:hypothetical protein